MLTLGLVFIKVSDQTELSGVTVLEPMILNEPERAGTVAVGVAVGVGVGVAEGVALPQPTKTMAAASTSDRGSNHFLIDFNKFFSFYFPLLFYSVV
jgi:hypothetical protein